MSGDAQEIGHRTLIAVGSKNSSTTRTWWGTSPRTDSALTDASLEESWWW